MRLIQVEGFFFFKISYTVSCSPVFFRVLVGSLPAGPPPVYLLINSPLIYHFFSCRIYWDYFHVFAIILLRFLLSFTFILVKPSFLNLDIFRHSREARLDRKATVILTSYGFNIASALKTTF